MFGGEEEHENHNQEATPRPQNRNPLIWMGAAVVVMAIAGILALASSHHEQATVNQLTAREGNLSATIATLQDQLNTTTQKLNDMTAVQAAAETKAQAAQQATQEAQAAKSVRTAAAKRTARRPAVDPRWQQMQSRLDAQQKQLDSTTDAITKTRSDLEGNISSTRDELNGSIAKNHEELVALEQRGERSYYEFDLSKSKSFQRTGPISISLRKTDTKHEHYDLSLMVDDNQLQKKNVDLYEPIWLNNSDNPQPLEIVVNKIDKDHVHGYVSSSKYTRAQLTPASVSGNAQASQTPAAGPAPAANVSPQSN
jgi:hypothetical protein